MKYLLLIVSMALLFFALPAQGQLWEKSKQYVQDYKEIAMAEMIRSGVPASITLAQGILESGSGQGKLCKRSNNHFGIKCKAEWTGERVYHNDDLQGECFRSYPNAFESFRDHSDFLRNRKHYAFLFALDPLDYKSWAKGLKKAGYATEPDYPENLIKVIEDYGLHQYSMLALQKDSTDKNNAKQDSLGQTASVKEKLFEIQVKEKQTPDTLKTDPAIPKPQKDAPFLQITSAQISDTISKKNPLPSTKEPLADTVVVKPKSYPEGTFEINKSKVIWAKEGIGLLSVAKANNLDLARLLEYNELEETTDVTASAQLLFLEKKQLKGGTDMHRVLPGETLYSVSQSEGIRLNKLLEYNKLLKNDTIKPGTDLLLAPSPQR